MIKFLCFMILLGLSQSFFFVNCNRQTKTTTGGSLKTQSRIQIAQVHYYSVQKVSDGDTATLKNLTDNSIVKVRFLCIDAPEKSQGEWGKESLKKLSELLPIGSKVTLQGSNRDLYGRTVAEVVNQKNVNINRKMVELGLAIYYPFQKGCSEYKDLEKQAKSTKSGVWSDPKFEMPWDYREKNGIGARGRHNKNKSSSTLSPRYKSSRIQRTTPQTISSIPSTSKYNQRVTTGSSASTPLNNNNNNNKASSVRQTHYSHKPSLSTNNPKASTSSVKQSTFRNKRK